MEFRGRIPRKEMGNASPGPAKYKVKGHFDHFSVATQIERTPVPPEQLPRWYSDPNMLSKFRQTAPGGMHASYSTQMLDPADLADPEGVEDPFAMSSESFPLEGQADVMASTSSAFHSSSAGDTLAAVQEH